MENNRSLEDTFDRILLSNIFKNRDVMRPSYIPKELPHRESQITRVGLILASALKGGTPSNLFIYGKTGTGKTAVVKYVIEKLSERALKLEQPFNIKSAYINCRIIDTNYRVLARLAESVNVEVPFTGLPTDEVYFRFKEALDSKPQLLTIVLDEIDKLVEKSGTDILYNLTRINTHLKNTRVNLVGITNDLKFKDYLDPRVLSSLSEEELVFPPYTALELQDILKQRAEMGFNKGVLDYGVINLCAALAAREHGDARRAIDLLRIAGEFAEREGAKIVTEEHVRKSMYQYEQDIVSQALISLPIQSKLVLLSIYLLQNNKVPEIITGDIYNVYSTLANIIQVDSLTQRRISDLINELDMHGIINATIVNKGRYGRTKRIKLAVSKHLIKSCLIKDGRIKRIFELKDIKTNKDFRDITYDLI
ncbi:MAG: ORC1-type DNA replication protein [Candidatus Odinarchaeia archaeon]